MDVRILEADLPEHGRPSLAKETMYGVAARSLRPDRARWRDAFEPEP